MELALDRGCGGSMRDFSLRSTASILWIAILATGCAVGTLSREDSGFDRRDAGSFRRRDAGTNARRDAGPRMDAGPEEERDSAVQPGEDAGDPVEDEDAGPIEVEEDAGPPPAIDGGPPIPPSDGRLFPDSAWFYQDIRAAAEHPRSAEITQWLEDNG